MLFLSSNLKITFMESSIEISLYPLTDEFVPEVVDFIERLKKHPEMKVEANGLSTQIFGNYRKIMQVLTDEMEKTFEKKHISVCVMKILNVANRT